MAKFLNVLHLDGEFMDANKTVLLNCEMLHNFKTVLQNSF